MKGVNYWEREENKMEIRIKRILALLICVVMIFSSTAFVSATDDEIDVSVWAPEDFTYTSYEKLLYGCDYTREIIIKGAAIAGFSE